MIKKYLIAALLLFTVIFAGCSTEVEEESKELVVESDTQEDQVTEESIDSEVEDDFKTQEDDIEMGELI